MSKISRFLWLFMAILYVALGVYFVIDYRETIKNKVAYKSQAYISLQANYSILSDQYSHLTNSYESRIETLEKTIETLKSNAEIEKNEAINALISDYEQQITDIKSDYEYKIRDLNNSTVDMARKLIEGGITQLSIPEGVTEIRDYAFKGMSSLTSVELPSTLVKIGKEAFFQTKITSIDIPQSVLYILDECFVGTNLTSIYVPKNVLVFGDMCLNNCKSLQSITFEPSNVPLYGRLNNGALASYLRGFAGNFKNYYVCERPVVNKNYGMGSYGFWNVHSDLGQTSIDCRRYYYDFVEGNNAFSDCVLPTTNSGRTLMWFVTMDDCLNNVNAYFATDTLPSLGRYYARYIESAS